MRLKKHIPNILSSTRLLSPFVLIPLILNGNLIGSVISLSGYLTTDALDGFLARKWHVQSDLGAKIDVVADKLILASLLVPIAVMNPLMIITLFLEGSISLVNVYRKIKGGNPKTIQFGRIKMVIISLFMVICYLSKLVMIPKILLNTFFAITTLFQMGTLYKYINCYLKEKENSLTNKENIEIVTSLEENKNNIELNSKNKKINLLEKEKKELLNLKDELLNLENDNNFFISDLKDEDKCLKMSKKI